MLDSPARYDEIRAKIKGKPALSRFYQEVYREYRRCLDSAPAGGVALELGSGAGFAKEVIPELVTSDVLSYSGVDCIVDGTRLPYPNETLKAICMLNVFHHIPDVAAFLREGERCLVPGGRILIVDQHVGLLSRLILRYLHHEPFDPDAAEWSFASTGPLSDANGALAWLVFSRDRVQFRQRFPRLSLQRYQPFAPLRYWLSGGLKSWSLVPGWGYGVARAVDRLLTAVFPDLGSFVYIELVKTPPS